MSKRINISGQKFGRWLVLDAYKIVKHHTQVLCRCECGTEEFIDDQSLKTGRSTSCGCYHKSMTNAMQTHGETKGKPSTEYNSWASMKARCNTPTNKNFPRWGGRGINVWEEWLVSFDKFLADMGRKPSKYHTLDRYPDKNGNYEPSNCRWATPKQQSNNTRRNLIISFHGVSKTVPEWSEIVKIKQGTLISRKHKGWTSADILNTPLLEFTRQNKAKLINHSFGYIN